MISINYRLINFVALFVFLLLLLHKSLAEFEKLSPKLKRTARHTYHISVDYKQNWYRANHYCKYYNMDLVTVENVTAYPQISAKIDLFNYGNETFWTAATDLGSANEFYWVTTGRQMDKTKLSDIIYKNKTAIGVGGSNAGSSSTPSSAATPTKGNNNCLALKHLEYIRENCMREHYFICQSYEIVNEIGRRLIFS